MLWSTRALNPSSELMTHAMSACQFVDWRSLISFESAARNGSGGPGRFGRLWPCGAEARTTMKMKLKIIDDTHGVKGNSACYYMPYATAHGLPVDCAGCSGVSKLVRHQYTLSEAEGTVCLHTHTEPHQGCSNF
jgi:hypothetical protein